MTMLEMTIQIPFENEKSAEIVWNSLKVDPEPPRSQMIKDMQIEGQVLVVKFRCQEARTMRVSVNSFFDLLTLVIQTMDQFAI